LQSAIFKNLEPMARFCDLTGKGPLFGHKVSHSNRKTKRKFLPNLQKKNFFVPELNEWINIKVSTSALRTINKKGLYSYLKELEKKGDIIIS
jgi:large subunit ribosomal protein L28